MGPTPQQVRLERALQGVEQLRQAALAAEKEFAAELDRVAPELRASADNLVHYLALRRHDLRILQDDLIRLGLSSLGRLEAHVMASLCAVLEALYRLLQRPIPDYLAVSPRITFDSGPALLAEHTGAILGPAAEGRRARIMVTMPSEAAEEPGLVRDLVAEAMDVMRVNCAHDGPAEWELMVGHLRKAVREVGRTCRVSFDLAGPKLRTGPVAPGPAVVKWRPVRDKLGRVTEPARVRFGRIAPADDQTVIPVQGALIEGAQAGDTIELTDTRDRVRVLTVVAVANGHVVCETDTTAYVVPGTHLELRRSGKRHAEDVVGPLPPSPQWLTLHPGDFLDVVRGETPGHDAQLDAEGEPVAPAVIGCPLAEVFVSVRVGDRIFFDDGKLGGVVEAVTEERLRVRIVSAVGGIVKLRGEKGINLPDSELQLPALTAKDLVDLAFVVRHGDMVALSFVQRPEDIEALYAELDRLQAARLGIILKIETRLAFERLTLLLLTAMRRPPLAVMVARGDLGVEVGFDRLSEVQEEILWFCEAAHVPVIWATQVLESLAKGGMPSRAEVTDAAMSGRAECVMLNKGPYIRETLRFFVDVLGRMEAHQQKKTARLRRLQVSEARYQKGRKPAAV
jgi:pyruvate kinase